jgi:hypothetical protein
MKKYSVLNNEKIENILSIEDIPKLINSVEKVHIEDNIFEYVKNLIFYSRNNQEIKEYLLY